ncbi:hypothetical protein PSPO01_01598 [Paraphaeosphaeria sporulosa]
MVHLLPRNALFRPAQGKYISVTTTSHIQRHMTVIARPRRETPVVLSDAWWTRTKSPNEGLLADRRLILVHVVGGDSKERSHRPDAGGFQKQEASGKSRFALGWAQMRAARGATVRRRPPFGVNRATWSPMLWRWTGERMNDMPQQRLRSNAGHWSGCWRARRDVHVWPWCCAEARVTAAVSDAHTAARPRSARRGIGRSGRNKALCGPMFRRRGAFQEAARAAAGILQGPVAWPALAWVLRGGPGIATPTHPAGTRTCPDHRSSNTLNARTAQLQP